MILSSWDHLLQWSHWLLCKYLWEISVTVEIHDGGGILQLNCAVVKLCELFYILCCTVFWEAIKPDSGLTCKQLHLLCSLKNLCQEHNCCPWRKQLKEPWVKEMTKLSNFEYPSFSAKLEALCTIVLGCFFLSCTEKVCGFFSCLQGNSWSANRNDCLFWCLCRRLSLRLGRWKSTEPRELLLLICLKIDLFIFACSSKPIAVLGTWKVLPFVRCSSLIADGSF